VQPVKHYFVTGATGAVGSALVPLLLEEPEVRVSLLIRASSAERLAERMEALYRYWEIGPGETGLRDRVRAFRGDTTQQRFGLTEDEYSALAASCTHIVHAAGVVRMNLPIEEARRSAVGSTRQIIAFALACKAVGILRKVEFVSTVGVGGRMPLVPEEWLDEPREFHNTYEQSKAEAENLLRQEMEAHKLPVTVHRPSMVVGDSITGKIIHYQVFYYLCEFLSGRQTRGLMPNLSGITLDTIPVDYVTKSLVWASNTPQSAGRILHLCSGPSDSIELNWLIGQVRKIFVAGGIDVPVLRRVPLRLFLGLLPAMHRVSPKPYKKAVRNLSIFLDYARDRQQFENGKTLVFLDVANHPLPSPEDYLQNLLEAYLHRPRS